MQRSLRKKLVQPNVEYNITEHCNLSCYLCDHSSPLLPTKFADLAEFSRDFTALARVFHAKQLRLVGGEPLLHPQLTLFIREARRIGIADSIVLLTNGVKLHLAPVELWELIDELWISVYPGINRKLNDHDCAQICAIHNVRLHFEYMREFKKTAINTRIEDAALINAIFEECKNSTCHTVHEGHFYKCCVAPFTRPRLASKGIDFDNRAVDGIALHGNKNLYEELSTCLYGRTPLAACSYCLGTSGPAAPHRQLNHRGRLMWLKEDNDPDVEAVRTKMMRRRTKLRRSFQIKAHRVRLLLRPRSRIRDLLRGAEEIQSESD